MPQSKREHTSTMKDVAKRAGVSQATVSYVINNTVGENIPAETRERVLAAVRELGYRPNNAARNMRTQRSNLVGFVTDTIATTPFAGAVIKGAQDVCREHGKLLLLVDTEGDLEVENAAIETMLEHRVEGIIYATMYHREVAVPANLRETQAVLLDCFSADRSIASVVPDEVGGGRLATELLLSKGHRRIGFLNNSDPIPATRGRLAGYRQALAAHGVDFDPALVGENLSDSRGGYAAALQVMAQAQPPTALFCFNDRMAMGAYDALRKLNLAIPKDVAVIGFDNQEVISDALYPGLSTMQLPHYAMGQWALRYLLEAGPAGAPPTQHVLECPFVARGSL